MQRRVGPGRILCVGVVFGTGVCVILCTLYSYQHVYGLVFTGVSLYPGVLSCVLVVRFMKGRKVCGVWCVLLVTCVWLSLSL